MMMTPVSICGSICAAALAVLYIPALWKPASHLIRPWNQCGGHQDGVLREHVYQHCPNQPVLKEAEAAWSHAHKSRLTIPITDSSKSTQQSLLDSFGFIEDTDWNWRRRQLAHLESTDRQNVRAKGYEKCTWAPAWWAEQYDPSFFCAYMVALGTAKDGVKFVCDPHRIGEQVAAGKGCLIYSIGSDGDFGFEQMMHTEISSACEIHTFDPNPVSYYNGEGAEAPKTVNYHAYPVGNKPPAKTVPAIISDLGHHGRTIDIFKIDCEGCEFDTYESWFSGNVDIRQILIEVHWDPCDDQMGSKMYKLMSYLLNRGYVVTYKAFNTMWDPEAPGSNIEFSFLKLGKNFTLHETHED